MDSSPDSSVVALDEAGPDGRCRWVDGGGHQWLIARQGGSLIVERPDTGESVVVRFPDLAAEALDGPPAEVWVLFCAADGHLFHCSICHEAEVIEFSRSARPKVDAPGPNRRRGCSCEAGRPDGC
jgi:hypothetical protein